MAKGTPRIKVVDLEVSGPLEEMGDLDGYDAIQGLVRIHRRPIGYVLVPVIDGVCSADALETAVEARYGLRAPDMPRRPSGTGRRRGVAEGSRDNRQPSVSVAVCTRDNPDELNRCLEALTGLDYPDLDLLVVDNAPGTSETRTLVKTRYSSVRYVCEPRPGLNWARNRAIECSRAEILAFTDDDVVADPGWIDALASIFREDPEVMALTGLVVPLELEVPAQIYFERYGGFGCGFARRRFDWSEGRVPKVHEILECGTGANMAFRRTIFRQIGSFDPALDAGTATNGGGDLEMFFRVLKEGLILVYEPLALVRHRHRSDYPRLRSQIESWGTGTMAAIVRSMRAYPDERRRLSRLAVLMLLRQLRRLLKSFIRPPGFPRALLLAELRGALAGPYRYWRASRAADRIGTGSVGEEMESSGRGTGG